MHIYADTASIQAAFISAHGTELGALLGQRMKELAAYGEPDLSTLVKIVVLAPGDTPEQVDAELGLSLLDRPCELIESHSEWFELTLVLSDDGYGVVLYVPKHPKTHHQLQAYCSAQIGQ